MNQKIFFKLIFCLLLTNTILATNYYFDPVRGDDLNHGTSMAYPFRSLKSAATLDFQPGDALFLATGNSFTGSLVLKDVHGTIENPIVVSSYSWGNTMEARRATIEAKGYLNGVYLVDCRHVEVKNLIITANGGGLKESYPESVNMRCGVLVTTTKPGEYSSIKLDNLLIRDVFFEDPGFERGVDEVKTANGSQNYGWGIRFINRTKGAVLKNLRVQNCEIKNVAHTGIKFTGQNHNIQDIVVYNNQVIETGGPGIQMSGVQKGYVANNLVNFSGSHNDSRKWGRGSGLWTWGTSDVVIEKNRFMNAKGPADSAGCHIDFNCKNVVVQYNFSANNAGGFCEILGNNFNCAYRYNISVNDGHRVKGEKGAFQEGKTFWLSGYVGKNRERHGPYYSYFYNNTIYVSKEIVSKVAVTKTAEGVLIANNIFCIDGASQAVLGDQYNPDKGQGGDVNHYIFENNLFLKSDFWPKEVLVQPKNSLIGDPLFFKMGGLEIADYIPANRALIINKGMVIPLIPNDTIGLTIGLKAEHDIFGNKIIGKPDLGAIELD